MPRLCSRCSRRHENSASGRRYSAGANETIPRGCAGGRLGRRCGLRRVGLGPQLRQIVAKLGRKGRSRAEAGRGRSHRSSVLRRILNDGFKDTGLVYELDEPFIGDPNALETGAIVSLVSGRYLMRAADGWMDPASAKIRKRLPEKVQRRWSSRPTTNSTACDQQAPDEATAAARGRWRWSRSPRRPAAPGSSRSRCARIARRPTFPSVRPA